MTAPRFGGPGRRTRGAALVAAALALAGPGQAGGASDAPVPPDEFPLHATPGHAPASGLVRLRQAWSPFGVSVTEDGTLTYEVEIATRGLPAAPAGQTYVAWITSPDLQRVERLGPLAADGTIRGSHAGAAFLVVVSREQVGTPCIPSTAPGAAGGDTAGGQAARWTGPVVLRGSSPGSRVAPLFGHSIFQRSPM